MTRTAHAPGATPSRWVGRALAGAVLLLASVALLGWYADVPELTSLHPGLQRMVPNTALGLGLLAALLLVSPERPASRRLAGLSAALVALLGLLTLVEVETGGDWGIDRLLPGTGFTPEQGTMAPSTATALALLGTAVALRHASERVSQALGVVAFFVGYVAVIGYLYGSSHLYAVGGYTHMALPTALSVTALSLATVLGAPHSALTGLLTEPGSAGRLVRSLLPFLAAGPPLIGWVSLNGQQRGWYDTHFAVGVLVTVLTVSTGSLLLRTALQVRRADAGRAVALHRLNDLNQRLEQLVDERTEALSAARARFEAAFASSPLATALTTLDGTVEDVNRLLPDLTGLERDELVGRDVATLFDDELVEHDLAQRAELLAGDTGSYALERQLRRDGAPCWVQVSVAVVRDDAGSQALIHQLEDITARRLAEDRVERLALYDSLTDLPNRVLLMDRLRQELAHADRSGRGVGVLFLDLDRFKVVNDSLGHHAGDRVLVEVADRLRAAARAADTVARLGGDEFVVLCTDLEAQAEALEIAEKLRALVARPVDLGGTAAEVDASVGVAFGTAHDDPEALLRRADQAMYRAKDHGRARAEVFDDALRAHITQRLDLEIGLRGATERGEIETWFQPIVDLESQEVVALEALARWRRPDRGVVLPGEFVHVAEEVGLIKEVGTAVLHQALAHAAELVEGPAVSINVSGRQLVRTDFGAVVEEALARTGVPPQRLWLELTESTLVEALDSAAHSLQALRAQGVRIALDDFGTGFSSFSQLRRFPVDLVKIDMTFTADLATSARDRAIVESIVRMADALDLDVVGEGVETLRQQELLRIFGCRYGQGYLYARPAPPASRTRDAVVVPQPQRPADERVERG